MKDLVEQLKTEHFLSAENITLLLKNDEINSELFRVADEIRKQHVGDEVHLRGLIEFSNFCVNSCLYCGLRCENKNIERYKLNIDKILKFAKNASEQGYKTVVLQSGEAKRYSIEQMQTIINEIKKFNLAITLSLGEKTFEEYKAYKEAGADRYLLRIETTDRNLYKKLHPNMSYENRVRCLEDLKKLNYEVGSGFLTGLPEQTLSSIANDLLFLENIKVDMAGIGPFIPHPDTPLADFSMDKTKQFNLALKTMAIMRLLLPDINIPATTAMETLNKDGRLIALQCGANVVMPNITDKIYREKYSIYPNKNKNAVGFDTPYNNAKIKIESIGRTVSKDFGISKAWEDKH